MARKVKLWWPPHLNSVATLPNKTNSTAKINPTCSFYWLFCSVDSHKRKTIAQPRLCSQGCAAKAVTQRNCNVRYAPAILDNTFKTTTSFIDTTVNETLRQVFSIQWQLFASVLPQSWIFVSDKLAAEGHPRQCNRQDAGCLGATCQARWNRYSLSPGTPLCYEPCAQARHHAEVSICDGRILLQFNIRQQALS